MMPSALAGATDVEGDTPTGSSDTHFRCAFRSATWDQIIGLLISSRQRLEHRVVRCTSTPNGTKPHEPGGPRVDYYACWLMSSGLSSSRSVRQ
jgi:hypothetical protein